MMLRRYHEEEEDFSAVDTLQEETSEEDKPSKERKAK